MNVSWALELLLMVLIQQIDSGFELALIRLGEPIALPLA